jgi:uncharacterized membrane protein
MLFWENWCLGFWWICPIFMVVMIIICAFALRRFCGMTGRLSSGVDGNRHQEATAEEILKRRYALGEISQKEYDEMRRHIQKGE